MRMQTRNLPNRFGHVVLIRLAFLAVMPAIIAAMSLPLAAQEASRNLLVNPDFARTYAARRSPEPYVRNMPGLDKNAAMPYAWTIQPNRWSGAGSETIGVISPAQVDGGPGAARCDQEVREHAAAAVGRGGARGHLYLCRLDQGQGDRDDSS